MTFSPPASSFSSWTAFVAWGLLQPPFILPNSLYSDFTQVFCSPVDLSESYSRMALAAYNVTIPVQSPMFHFAPYRDEDVSGVWDAWCPPRAHHDNGKHTKPRVSTTASISWTGTAVYLLGQALPYLYSTSLDGADITHGYRNAEEDLLASYDGLTYGDHTLQVSVVNAQEVHVAAVIITVGIVPEG